jgi:hypothetical protein
MMKGVEMKTKASKAVVAAMVVLGLALTITGCSTATPTDTPGVDRMGEYVLKQFGPELWVVLGYRFANSQMGDEWMILELALSSPNGQTAEVTREEIYLLSPSGKRIPLPTQKQFNEAWGSLRSTIERANVNRDPLGYFPQRPEECAIQFFVTPGQGVSFDQVTLNDRRECFGRLFFDVPGGIQSGRWVLGIDLEESEIRIPFELGE